jgi:hypothetical protein
MLTDMSRNRVIVATYPKNFNFRLGVDPGELTELLLSGGVAVDMIFCLEKIFHFRGSRFK